MKKVIKITLSIAAAAIIAGGLLMSTNDASAGDTEGCKGEGVCSLDGIHYPFAPDNGEA